MQRVFQALFRHRFYLALVIFTALSARAIGFAPNLYAIAASF
ncbi:hypothetical protein [Spirabiliibacterium mucosae]|nr:hypothetical protein [Spirabiliibacterium mucosae]